MGHRSGALSFKPDEALNILTKYFTAVQSKGNDWEAQFCQENKVTPNTLMILGALLNRCQTNAQRILGKQLMLSASALGDESATLQLLRPALRTGRLQSLDYAAPIQQLGKLAKSGSVPSMVLLGRIKQDQGREKEALELFRKAASGAQDPGSEVSSGISDALVYEGQIHLKNGKTSAAQTSFSKAALDYDNPLAYYLLANMQSSKTSESTREVYLMKAASSGIVDASYDLGLMYLDRSETSGDHEEMIMGREWLALAAESGHGESLLKLASAEREQTNMKCAMEYLNRAMKHPDVDIAKRAIALQEEWSV